VPEKWASLIFRHGHITIEAAKNSMEDEMPEQSNENKSKSHHDPRVMSIWIGVFFVLGLAIGVISGGPLYGAIIGILAGIAFGWMKSRRSF